MRHFYRSESLKFRGPRISKALRVLVAAIIAPTLSAVAASETLKSPVTSLDVAAASEAFSDAVRNAGQFPPYVQVLFLGENQIAVASTDGFDRPSWAAEENRPERVVHLTIDIFSIDGGALRRTTQLRYLSGSLKNRVVALPSGRLLVSAGRDIYLYDDGQHLVVKKTIERVCGLASPWPDDAFYRVSLFASSEDLALLRISLQKLVPTRKGVPGTKLNAVADAANSHSCWFSTEDLSLKGELRAQPPYEVVTPGHLKAYEDQVVDVSMRTTPEGVNLLRLRPEDHCGYRLLRLNEGLSNFFLLRAEHAISFECRGGEFTFDRNGQVRTIPLKTRDMANFWTDAWKVPLAILLSGNVKVGILSGGFRVAENAELVNYETGRTLLLPPLKLSAPPGIYVGSGIVYALSPEGGWLAVLSRTTLALYRVPDEMR